MQTQLLVSFSQLIDKYPQQFTERLDSLYDKLRNFVCYDDDQTASKIDCLCGLLGVSACVNTEKFCSMYQNIITYLNKIVGRTVNVDEDGEDLDTMVNYAQAVRMFAEKYVSYYSKLVAENAGGSLDPSQFVEQLFALIRVMN